MTSANAGTQLMGGPALPFTVTTAILTGSDSSSHAQLVLGPLAHSALRVVLTFSR